MATQTPEFNFRGESLDRFLDLVASRAPAPGGGAVAAVAAAMAASLVAMAARLSTGTLADAPAITAQAERLRHMTTAMADADSTAYQEVIAAFALPGDIDPDDRRDRIRETLTHATEVPAELAEVAIEIAALSVRVLEDGNSTLKGDAFTAMLLALAVVRASAVIVECNVEQGQLQGDWVARTTKLAAMAEGLYRRIDVSWADGRASGIGLHQDE